MPCSIQIRSLIRIKQKNKQVVQKQKNKHKDHHKADFTVFDLTEFKCSKADCKQSQQHPGIISDHTCEREQQEKCQLGCSCHFVYHAVAVQLNDEDTEVRAEILPDVGECIQDVYIYDVYDAEKRKVVKDKPNYTYNCSAVQLAYIIDTDVFAEEYGFDFPTIVTTTGTEIKHDDGVLTLMIEYSCLDRLETISEQDIGLSLYDVYDKDEKIVIGYAHCGKHSKEKDEGLSATGWSHTFGSDIIPHLCVKTAFVDGEVTPPELDNPHIYDGLSVRFVGAKVNPLLWFKAYRTDVNKDLLDSISAIQVKK